MSPSVSIPDILASPTNCIRSLAPGHIHDLPKRVWDYFSAVLDQEDALDQVPIADARSPLQSFQAGSVVCFPAMVQDTSIAPELYLSEFSDGNPGGWGMSDGENDDDVDSSRLKECTVIWAVSIPGQGSWCFKERPQDSALATSVQPTQPHKCPLRSPLSGAQVKVYDGDESRKLRVTDIAKFYGILTFEPLHSHSETASNHVVPTIHVLFLIPLPITIVPRKYPLSPDVRATRQAFINWLADGALGGDALAAEWLILAAISRVRTRPTLLPLTLTISRFPQPRDTSSNMPALHHLLAAVIPLVSTLPLSLTLLNQSSFNPCSIEEDLHSGFLQLPKGSLVLFTESAIEEGRLTSAGLSNIRAVEEVMTQQRLEYKFPFSDLHFDTDLSVVVLAQGKASPFFKTQVNVPLCPTTVDTCYQPSPSIELPIEELQHFRMLIGGSMIGNTTINDEVASSITDDFVRMRSHPGLAQTSDISKEFTTDDLSQHLLVARLSALSFHRNVVTFDDWERAKVLFAGISQRLGS